MTFFCHLLWENICIWILLINIAGTKVRPSYDHLSCAIFSSFNFMVIFNADIAESQLMLLLKITIKLKELKIALLGS